MKQLFVLLQFLAMLPTLALAQSSTTYLGVSGSQGYGKTTMAFAPSGGLTLTFTLTNSYYGTCYSGATCNINSGILNATLPDGTIISLTTVSGQMNTGTISNPGWLKATATDPNTSLEYEVDTTFTLHRNCYRTCGAPFPVFQSGSLIVTTPI